MSIQHNARKKTPEEVVQQQVETYNKHDLEAFIATYSPNIEIIRHIGADVSVRGHDEMRRTWGPTFEKFPALYCSIKNRMILGNFVIDYEEVTGITDGDVLHAIAIYEVNDEAIQKVWFISS